MKRFIIYITIITPLITIAQTPTDLHILHKKIIPKLQILTHEESQQLYDHLINYQIKTKTSRQRFFLGSISAFLMQFHTSPSRTDAGLPRPSSNPAPSSILTGTITSITDGDTFSFIPSHTTSGTDVGLPRPVRLLGIDTPEKGEIGNREATEYLTDTLLNTSVTLITPPDITTDKYGRILAYVLTASGTLLNLDLLEQGFARTMIRQEHPFIPLFQSAETAQNPTKLTRRLYCTDFQTCEQARSAVASGSAYLDGDGDGLPCETSLCKGYGQKNE